TGGRSAGRIVRGCRQTYRCPRDNATDCRRRGDPLRDIGLIADVVGPGGGTGPKGLDINLGTGGLEVAVVNSSTGIIQFCAIKGGGAVVQAVDNRGIC